jgi:hypothetical protein
MNQEIKKSNTCFTLDLEANEARIHPESSVVSSIFEDFPRFFQRSIQL